MKNEKWNQLLFDTQMKTALSVLDEKCRLRVAEGNMQNTDVYSFKYAAYYFHDQINRSESLHFGYAEYEYHSGWRK